jgi:hypothetical protein
MKKKTVVKTEPSVNKKASRKDEPNTRGWVTCGTCEDGNVIQVGAIAREFTGGLLMASQKPDGGIRPILCGEVWRRCFAILGFNATPIRNEATKLFTSSYDNFIQTAGIRDGASHCAKILVHHKHVMCVMNMSHDLLDPNPANTIDFIMMTDRAYSTKNTWYIEKEKNPCPRELMFPGSFAKARGRDEG